VETIAIISIFVLAVFVGFEVVSKVSSTLHTPLMSGANAIHGVILVGAIIVADHSETALELGLSVAAIVLATVNMVGGFVVTDRMLEMFKGKSKQEKSSSGSVGKSSGGSAGNSGAGNSGAGNS
jgi:NAD(P) transhydrogenase subunit alpha